MRLSGTNYLFIIPESYGSSQNGTLFINLKNGDMTDFSGMVRKLLHVEDSYDDTLWMSFKWVDDFTEDLDLDGELYKSNFTNPYHFGRIINENELIGIDKMLDTILIHASVNNSDAWTAYRVGEAFHAMDKKNVAENELMMKNRKRKFFFI